MTAENLEKEKDGTKIENNQPLNSAAKAAGQAQDQFTEENLERLAALNLSSDRILQPRFSTAMIRLVSALAGVAALVLIYFIFKLFV